MSTATKTFSILAADKLAKEGLDWIESQPDATLADHAGIDEKQLAEIIGQHDAVIVRSGVNITAEVLRNPGSLKVIARAGVGVDNIDLAAATEKGILVVNTAEASTLTTAEHAFALLLATARQIGPACKTLAAGGWDRSKFKGRQLAGKTLGVVGFGRIGQAVAERALAFEMDVLAFDPFLNAETAMDGRVKVIRDFKDLVPKVDMITFHVPLNDHTRGMLNLEVMKTARPHLIVINAARGGVVDENDLVTALDEGIIAAAGFDVFTTEPPAADHPLRDHPKALVTPHLGASTVEAQQAVSIDAAKSALAYLRGEGIKGAVNAGGIRVDLSPIQAAYADLIDRMASLIGPMITRGICNVTLELRGSELTSAASTLERTALTRLLGDRLDSPVNLINVSALARDRSITCKTVTSEVDTPGGTQATLVVEGPRDAVDTATHPDDLTRRIVGRVYDDLRPRVVEINGYHMDMIPRGDMILLQNEDRPGMIGMVGSVMGEAGINIADMTISRRASSEGNVTALMLLKVDAAPEPKVLEQVSTCAGILKAAAVKLPSITAG
ncbi:phosphoglycerate dehydrogenase [Mucisphaera calidilacus]|uniref:D-3-phosphoglycerate dehydrogenase n=1 Tax=Mucisphaera calidilacus TaxID=2527982 RepID=A0A518BW50_9BACT|nr:phosphoglycerate dehydrogenase [Mucisphaera calidilacus]QDU71154.1 D-3-phosphoglycerate dehydrogenase [Mucisphaera calidilacus]